MDAVVRARGWWRRLTLCSRLLAWGLLASLALARAGPIPQNDSQALLGALVDSWSGEYDDVEQVIFDERGSSTLLFGDDRRIRTIVSPVELPWLGQYVLYLEEFPQDDPDDTRREVLLWLAPAGSGFGGAIRVRQLTFREPERWRGLYEHEELARRLRKGDLAAIRDAFEQFDRVLGVLSLRRKEDEQPPVPIDEIDELIEERQAAKRRRDFAAADRIRADLAERGVLLEDSPQGTRWKRK